ncbi:MAG: ABC transporter ATP-binding protein [Proteobacteria bacterium]|nr:ABC transporter ATP-binding protein [Pseudomonadota bacterium]
MSGADGAARQADPEDGPIVRFAGVAKSYDGALYVVRNLDLDIHRGEFLTLLGPSGSGKTTTLMMLAGFEAPTHGEILLAGRPVTNVPPHKRNLGVVFQNYALFPHMTVAENVAFPLLARKMAKGDIPGRVERALEMVRLGQFGARRPAQLSGGQQQRIALARALVFEPELVLMDEPLGALDKQLREQMQIEIKHIHERLGVTVVYVTHDQSEALTMSDRIAVFDDGEIQQIADATTLYERPDNAFVAQFIGENNRFLGKVTAVDGKYLTVETAGGDVIEALAVKAGAVGEATSLSLRPERAVIDPAAGTCANRFETRVEELIYLGDHTRVRVRVCGDDGFIVKVPNATGRPELALGQDITIGWEAEDCRALDAPGISIGSDIESKR